VDIHYPIEIEKRKNPHLQCGLGAASPQFLGGFYPGAEPGNYAGESPKAVGRLPDRKTLLAD